MVAETHLLNHAAFLSSPISFQIHSPTDSQIHPDSGATSIFGEILVSAGIASEAEPLVVAPRAPRLDDDEDLDEEEEDEDDYEDDDELEDDEEEDDEEDDDDDDDEEEDDEEEDEEDDDDEDDDDEDDDTLRVSQKYANERKRPKNRMSSPLCP